MQAAFKLVITTADTRGEGAFPNHRKEHRMSLKFGTSLRRALRAQRTASSEDVHFHTGPGGRVYPCGVHHCESPHLTAREIGHFQG
jgi:hypothetical protein